MKILAGIVAIAFASIVVFSFLTMSHDNGHAECLAATAQRAVCPGASVSSFISFHSATFHELSEAHVDVGVALLFAGVTLLAWAGLLLARRAAQALVRLASSTRNTLAPIPSSLSSIQYWIALRERGDPALAV